VPLSEHSVSSGKNSQADPPTHSHAYADKLEINHKFKMLS